MFKANYRIFSNLWYVLSGTQKADNKLEKEFISIWEKRIEQRMSNDLDWDIDDLSYDPDEVLQEII